MIVNDTPESIEVSHHDLTVMYDKQGDYITFNDGLILGVKFKSLPNLRALMVELIDRVESQRRLDEQLQEARSGDG